MSNDIKINDVDVIAYESATDDKRSILKIAWDSNIGFGQYEICFTNNSDEDGEFFTTVKIEGDSECMDSIEKKEFIKMLFGKIVDKMEIVG